MGKTTVTPTKSERITGQVRGRGTGLNDVGRFERRACLPVDDGWGIPEDELEVCRTKVTDEQITKAITRNTSPDIFFDRSLNPYRGCEHGCIYCFARPSHAYLGMSAGLDFETRLIARPNAPQALEREFRRPNYVVDVLAVGTNTDAYQPIEKDRRIMRGVLEVLQRFKHPVSIVTKGSLIERDIDILEDMASDTLASASISITTLDAKLARQMEPRVPSPARRLKTIERLAAAGIPVRVSVSPMIPGLTDHELESIVRSARDAGAIAASTISLRLPGEVSSLFQDWLAREVPGQAARVMGRVRQMHGGRDYKSSFGHRMRGEGTHADLMRRRFKITCKRVGLAEHLQPLRTDLFVRPAQDGGQLSLF